MFGFPGTVFSELVFAGFMQANLAVSASVAFLPLVYTFVTNVARDLRFESVRN